ncbi:50S ribosomal protein L13 [Varibaculum prostatecancerukia]|uniref:50S ribosomal protein L13 n=1 Tax=Varibaculum prostatecancerukia TaxID=2811781 RepID=UPI001C005436|nr:50S ribosomal protein L13 [Varibaculum prostatecancerukia]
MRTYNPKAGDTQDKKWYVIDAEDVVLGRLAAVAAKLLRGKHKPTYTPNEDMGDHVIIVNAAKVGLTGNKREQKRAYRHSGYPGGLKSLAYGDLLDKKPEVAVQKAVRGMVPHTKLGRAQMKKLHVFAGPEHDHAAQQPEPYEIKKIAQ